MITIGCDPELFVKSGDKFINAHKLVEGTKDNPQEVMDGAVQVDGMALEFNINPAKTQKEFVHNIESVLQQLRMLVPQELDFAITPVAHFDKEYFEKQPEESRILGCDPDFNGWSGEINKKPNNAVTFRTAAGHVHVGWKGEKDFKLQCDIAKQMDFFLGLPSVIFDKDTERRSLYGKAGAFRPKEYGIEYRVLSNAWLLKKNRVKWVYSAAQKAIKEFFKGNLLFNKYGDIQAIINNSDEKECRAIMKKEGIVCPI